MYIHHESQVPDRDAALDFIDRYGFAVLVGADLQATHLPLCLDRDRAALIGHMARANPQWRSLDAARVLAVFHGPHSFSSPVWYGHTPAVPTWNYGAVHVRGMAQLLDQDGTIDAINRVVIQYEPALLEERSVLTEEVVDRLMSAVVGFEIRIEELQGSFKLGQERSGPQQQGILKGLESSGSLDAALLLEFMREQSLGTGEA